MATLPAEISAAGLPASLDGQAGGVPLGRTGILRGEFVSGLGALPAVRQVGLLVGIAASIALGVSLVLWLQTPDYRPITGGFDTYDDARVTELLEQNGISFRIDPRSGMVLVDAGRYDDAKIKLAQADLLGSAGAQGATLSEPAPFGSSQQAESNRFLRALEAELSRSIGTVQSIKHARVHIAMPRGTAFVRDQREPSASVAVQLQHGRDLQRDQVRAIMNLVARAVPELKPENVSVVDQQGRLLSGQEDDQLAEETDRQYQFKRKQEDDIARKVQDILLPTVGEGRFRVQVSADVDFTWQEETAEQFNPDTPAIRSEQSVDEQRSAGVAESGIPGALSNTPPAVATTPESVAQGDANQVPPAAAGAAAAGSTAAAGNSRRESTRNYELDRKYSHIRHQLGQVRRLTVSVLVDDVPAVTAAQGETPAKTTYEPWTDGELERLSVMVKSAIGYDAARGDVVSVLNAPFVDLPATAEDVPPIWMEAWFQELAKMVLVAVVVLGIGIGVLRPAFRMVTQVGSDAEASSLAPPPPNPLITDEALDEALEDIVTLSPSAQSVLASSAGYGPQLDAVRGLIAADPARVAAVVKSWVSIDE